MKLTPQNIGMGLPQGKNFSPNLNRFCMIHPCDGRTDGQMDGLQHNAICCRALKIS